MPLTLPPVRRFVATVLHMALIASLAIIAVPAWAAPGEHVIAAGRETEIVGLLPPFVPGGDVQDGWRISEVQIQQAAIRLVLAHVDGGEGSVELGHSDEVSRPDATTPSFAVTVSGPPAMAGARDALLGAVRANDDGEFWADSAPEAGPFTHRASESSREPLPVRLQRSMTGAFTVFRDGAVRCAIGLLLLFGMLSRQVRRGPRWMPPVLAGITLVGGGVRWLMTQDTTMDAWPYTRTVPLAAHTWTGSTAQALGDLFNVHAYFLDFAGTFTFVFALVTPIAVYCHGSQILSSHRAGLIAATLIAFLPAHIRFSHCETAFIPSLALSCLSFSIIHSSLRETSGFWRWISFLALFPATVMAFGARPLNALFLPLMLFTATVLVPSSVPRGRKAVVCIVLLLAGVANYVWHLNIYFHNEVRDGLSIHVLWEGFMAFFSFTHNTLIRPAMTPPVLVLAALGGLAVTWMDGRRKISAFLIVWLGMFYVSHGLVLPMSPFMQARYHLHLAVPFVLMASLGLEALWLSRPKAAMGVAVLVAASPLIHMGFIRDVAFNDMREFAMVRDLAVQIPEGCTILELGARDHAEGDRRFHRAGWQNVDGVVGYRFTSVNIGGPEDPDDPVSATARALMADPPECFYYFRGLPCWYDKEVMEPISPACGIIEAELNLEPVSEITFETRLYNDPMIKGFAPDFHTINLGLYRVLPPAAPAE